MSSYSRDQKPLLPQDLSERRLHSLRQVYRDYAYERAEEGFNAIVLGHCHDQDGLSFKSGHRKVEYLNVGFPRVHGTYVEWDSSTGELSRKPFKVQARLTG